ncbi:SHOCT domain-containing protein [Kitasatospora sp. NPDC088548]|uniref:SHOCT domain-containing protein n=1 Tax=Kitasatospora sp. NPDC088548 TaxID=3364075 RepID=UPI00382786F6
MMRHWYGHGHGHVLGGWGSGLMVVVGLLVLAVLVMAAIALFRYVSRSLRPAPQGPAAAGSAGAPGRAATPTPEQLLAERFARGEIDAEEYRHRLDVLRSVNGPGEPGPGGG